MLTPSRSRKGILEGLGTIDKHSAHIGMCGKRAAGRRKPGVYSGQRRAAGDSTGAPPGAAVDKRGNNVRQLRAGRHVGMQRAAPPDAVAAPGRGFSQPGTRVLLRRPVPAAGTVLRVISVSC